MIFGGSGFLCSTICSWDFSMWYAEVCSYSLVYIILYDVELLNPFLEMVDFQTVSSWGQLGITVSICLQAHIRQNRITASYCIDMFSLKGPAKILPELLLQFPLPQSIYKSCSSTEGTVREWTSSAQALCMGKTLLLQGVWDQANVEVLLSWQGRDGNQCC